MKVGDMVILQNLPPSWGNIGLITNIFISNSDTGTISLFTAALENCSIPWHKSDVYIEKIIEI